MKKILIFNNEKKAKQLLERLNTNANLPREISKTITKIKKHQAQEKWFLYKDCLEDEKYAGGLRGKSLNKQEIINSANDFSEATKTDQQLIDEGFLPNEEFLII